MDILKSYISRKQQFNLTKFHVILLLICAIITAFAVGSVWLASQQPLFRDFIHELPNIDIRNGMVQAPKDFVWKKEIPGTKTVFYIDTTHDYPSMSGENGIFLSRQGLGLLFQGREEVYRFTDEDVTINETTLQEMLYRSLFDLAGVVCVTFMIFLILGYWGTVGLTRGILWLFRQNRPKQLIYRSSVIGWYGVAILNIGLIISGHGFSLLSAIVLAAIMSSFCVTQVQPD